MAQACGRFGSWLKLRKRTVSRAGGGAGGGDSQTAWVSAVVAGSRVGRLVGSRAVCFQVEWRVGIDSAFTRSRIARAQARLPFVTRPGMELLRSVCRLFGKA